MFPILKSKELIISLNNTHTMWQCDFTVKVRRNIQIASHISVPAGAALGNCQLPSLNKTEAQIIIY